MANIDYSKKTREELYVLLADAQHRDGAVKALQALDAAPQSSGSLRTSGPQVRRMQEHLARELIASEIPERSAASPFARSSIGARFGGAMRGREVRERRGLP